MKKIIYLLVLSSVVFVTCKKENVTKDPNAGVIRGCMDPMSLNYNPDATEDDGNCLYLASSQVEKRNVVLEEYTGVRCTFCPDGHRRAQSFSDAHPGRVVLINVHTGGYANPQAGWPDYTTKFGNSLSGKAGMGQSGTGYPAGSLSRNNFSGEPTMTSYKMVAGDNYTLLNRGGWWNTTNSSSPGGDILLAKDAPVNIGLKLKFFNPASREAKVLVEMYFTESIPEGSRLNLVMLESNMKGRQIDAGVDNPNYIHKHMLRDMITGLWGEALDASSVVKGKRIQKEYSYIVPDKDKNNLDIVPENCSFAAFITSPTYQDIYNGTEIPLK